MRDAFPVPCMNPPATALEQIGAISASLMSNRCAAVYPTVLDESIDDDAVSACEVREVHATAFSRAFARLILLLRIHDAVFAVICTVGVASKFHDHFGHTPVISLNSASA